ncbi:CoA-binding protein [Lutibacter profundi]|uniref:CoA-binding protein n=1 Tax=Lutibacter profundi TaxID=1622118 RepID=A0A0X8G5V5_9FLAO|nr:CoA-binding protein [Lutibacter profundi]AMC10595.1 CoA-binding protein [Lutibacter profundi]
MKRTLVLGASINPNRYSYIAIQRLVEHKYEVRAVGRREGNICGVNIFKTKKIFKNIDTVSLYLGAKNQVEYYDYILKLNPKRVLFNPGTENSELEEILSLNNIAFERACTLVLLSIGAY